MGVEELPAPAGNAAIGRSGDRQTGAVSFAMKRRTMAPGVLDSSREVAAILKGACDIRHDARGAAGRTMSHKGRSTQTAADSDALARAATRSRSMSGTNSPVLAPGRVAIRPKLV